MPPTFSLESVLRLRQQKEDAEEQALSALLSRRNHLEATLGRVKREMWQWGQDRARYTSHAEVCAVLQGHYARLALLRDAEAQLKGQLVELERCYLEQRQAYLAARQSRELLSELKQQQRKAWDKAELKSDQRQLEDLLLGRRHVDPHA